MPKIISCNSNPGYIGGSAIIASPGYIKRTYNDLVLHDILYITLEFVIVGNWQPPDWFSINVDGVSSVQWSLASKITSSSGVNCGTTPSPGFHGFIQGTIFHKASSVTIAINFSVSQVGSNSNGPIIGVRDVTILQKYSQGGDFQGIYVITSDNTVPNRSGCNKRSFLNNNGGICQSCPSSTCDVCTGLGGQDCMKSTDLGTYFDGTNFYSCTSGCVFCTGPTANDCVQCDFGYVLDIDNSCKTSCTSPYISSGTLYPRCRLPCGSNQYLYWNNTCRDSCNYPLQVDTNNRQCTYPCNKAYAEFLYWNGSCLSICQFSPKNEGGYAFCDPCPQGYYLYLNENVCKMGCTYPYIIQRFVYCELDLSSSDIKQTATMSKVISNGRLAQGIGSVILSLLSPGDPSGFTLSALTKTLLYTRYMDLKYSPRLQSVFDQQSLNKSSIELLRRAQNVLKDHMRKYPLPKMFDHYGLHSSFIVNFFEPAVILAFVFSVALLVFLLNYCCKQGTRLKSIFEKIKNTLQWNLLLTLYTSNYDGLILFTSLEIRTTNSFYSFLPALSFTLSCLSIVIALLISFKMIKTIRALNKETRGSSSQEQRSQAIADFTKKHIKFQVFFACFRDSNLLQQSFFLIFTTRLIIFYIIIAVLIYHPFVQALLIMLMSICMVLYLCFKYPIKNKLRLGQHIIQEIILLVVNACVLVVACVDLSQKEGYSTKRITGEIFLYCNTILSMLSFVFPVLMVIEKLIILAQSKRLSESREGVISISHKTLPVNIAIRARQDRLQSNNDSNLVLFQGGLNQSQIDDGSLGATNLNFTSQIEVGRTNNSGMNQINTIELTENSRNMQGRSKETERAQLDQLEMTSLARRNMAESNKQLDPNKSKRKKQNKLQSSLKPQCQQSNKLDMICNDSLPSQLGGYKLSPNPGLKSMTGVSNAGALVSNAISRDNSIGLDTSLKKSEIETSWLRVNQERRYQIRGAEQYPSIIQEINEMSVDNDKYLNEPTYGNHSGIINLLRIKKPRNLR